MLGRFVISDLPENSQSNDAIVPTISINEAQGGSTQPVISEEIRPESIEGSAAYNEALIPVHQPEYPNHIHPDRIGNSGARKDRDTFPSNLAQIFQESLNENVTSS